jgi:hypothetical protein
MIDLDAIQARAEAATPGPWRLTDGGWGEFVQDSEGRELWALRHTPEVADAEFIAHARADVPALVAELHAARKIIAEARYHWGKFPCMDELLAAYDKVTGKVSR